MSRILLREPHLHLLRSWWRFHLLCFRVVVSLSHLQGFHGCTFKLCGTACSAFQGRRWGQQVAVLSGANGGLSSAAFSWIPTRFQTEI